MRPNKRERQKQKLFPNGPVVCDKRRRWKLWYHWVERDTGREVSPPCSDTTTVSNNSEMYFGYLQLRENGSPHIKLFHLAPEKMKIIECFEVYHNTWKRINLPSIFKVDRIELEYEDEDKLPTYRTFDSPQPPEVNLHAFDQAVADALKLSKEINAKLDTAIAKARGTYEGLVLRDETPYKIKAQGAVVETLIAGTKVKGTYV